ncbi:hypothetical protein EXT47_14630 [Pseudoalteromonas sp. CO342X]|uniref:hypothetical protein n=1 Tax=Pseudoalteromonas sp. CO342X TaxID=1777270 RepID=UPI001022D8E9|nr:hypothetical protein [Pseudoalteromonas sp. CO342X]RZG14061.1 hypothetical protein EXT47_14630 [Pseudoalteromonas sp. CO342X]
MVGVSDLLLWWVRGLTCAKEALSWLAMYHSAMNEDKSRYDPYAQQPFSYWVILCPEISHHQS